MEYNKFDLINCRRYDGEHIYTLPCPKRCDNCDNRRTRLLCKYREQRHMAFSASEIDIKYIYHPELLALNEEEAVKDKNQICKIHEYEENIVGKVKGGRFSLLLASPHPGNGKTTSALRLGMSYLEKRVDYVSEHNDNLVAIFPVLFVSWPEYVDARNRSYQTHNNKYKGYTWSQFELLMKLTDLLIIDDLGCTACTKQELNTLYNVLDYRSKENKSNIFTTNLAPDILKEQLGDRIYDRAIPKGTEILVFHDSSHREVF